jgi:hypothetical protein
LHNQVLRKRSQYFSADTLWGMREGAERVITLEDVHPEDFQWFLEGLYR